MILKNYIKCVTQYLEKNKKIRILQKQIKCITRYLKKRKKWVSYTKGLCVYCIQHSLVNNEYKTL